MTVSCYLQGTAKGDEIVRMFAKGSKGKLANNTDYIKARSLDSDPVFLWGCLRGSDLILKQCLETGHEFYYGDNCYYGNKAYLRITHNGLQNTKFTPRQSDRFIQNPINIKPWRKTGSQIIIFPPTESFAHIFNKQNWLEDTICRLKEYTDRPIYVRYKPAETKIGWENGYMINAGHIKRPDASKLNLTEELEDAWAVVAFQSSAVWEAIAQGVPAFVDPINAASVMGNTDISTIETPVLDDQEKHFWHINYCQFTREEISNGTAWRIVNGHG
jgi:hypothetical protein